ncbi:MAG TPA: PhnD/SsuA/transferrin family substrate-binding protein [Actinomycetes bacterium]|nr:PhnD/SsuA/transferrin family substrate-binding protein [Actinomycetes bacterium]
MEDDTLVVGAVAYDPKVVTIWEGFKAWFARHGLRLDYVLYSNYERLVEAHLAGHVDVAWNSPLAWVRARRLAAAQGREVHAVAMRDTDCDLRSVIVVRADPTIDEVAGLRGRTVGVGAVDSPQATLLPLSYLRAHGLTPGVDVEVRSFEVLPGKHGDHVGGERDAAAALVAGLVDAACVLEGNHAGFQADGTLPAGSTRVLARTGAYDHCNFTVTDHAPPALVERFRALLLGMSYDDPEVRPLLDLEGLRAWRPGRVDGYAPLEAAVDQAGFYDREGRPTATGYRY